MAEKKNDNRKDRFSWSAGQVEITLPNGKKLEPKKPKKTTKKSK